MELNCKTILVITGKSDDSIPIFQQIVYVICVRNHVRLVTALWETVRYDEHTHTYAVQPIAEPVWSVVPVENLYDLQPYHAAKAYKEGDSDLCYNSSQD